VIPCTTFNGKKLYKVIRGGQSYHGGGFTWSLPKGDEPGDWHEHEGPLVLCQSGLHLTWDAPAWWEPGAEVYEVDAEGLGDSRDDGAKVVARRVRLLRIADPGECRVVNAGVYEATSGTWRAYGSATVRASDSATVTAYDSATVTAYGSATVTAYGSATVRASDSATVTATGSATVRASGYATVTAYGSATTVKPRYSHAVVNLEDDAVLVDRTGERPVCTVGGAT
jgi:hypothetical protein